MQSTFAAVISPAVVIFACLSTLSGCYGQAQGLPPHQNSSKTWKCRLAQVLREAQQV